jgi:proline iminopeptidase
MFVDVDGARLFFDVEGAGLVPDGSRMRAKPTLILPYGGPGYDHTHYKPAFSALADVAQIVYLDHRGNGRSSGDDPETWNLARWGDDLKSLCDTLGIENRSSTAHHSAAWSLWHMPRGILDTLAS